MTLSMDEQARMTTNRILSRMISERVVAEAELVERLVQDIEEDLLSFRVEDPRSPLFHKLVDSHLRMNGLEGIEADEIDDKLDMQQRLFPPVSAGEAKKTTQTGAGAEENAAGVESSAGPVSDATREEPGEESEKDVNRLFEPAPVHKTMLDLSPNALKVLEKRYLRKNDDGEPVEEPIDMFRRVAENIAKADQKFNPKAPVRKVAREFLEAMTGLRFLPNSPTIMNAGRELQQLSACFVLPVEDSMESIFETIKNTALIQKSGGGTGFSFSRLRPKNDRVQSTKGVSSGPVSFMKAFDAATETVKQGGTRRGANMAILRVDHPDILEFISCKKDQKELNNFNISVALTEEFMAAVGEDREYGLYNPRSNELVRKLSARKVFDAVVNLAWLNGEPGIVFIDRMNRDNPTPTVAEIEATNPCGEQPLLPYESCNLASVNLSLMVKEKGGRTVVDYRTLGSTVRTAVHFLDNVIEQNRFPLKAIEEQTRANRKIGLGVMGWADMLIKLGIPYDSDEALDLADEVMEYISTQARKASVKLAKERGAFPNFEISTWFRDGHKPLRNATCTTIAPTGSISIIAGCSSGIEPLFAVSYIRRVLDGEELVEVHPLFLETARRRGFFREELMEKIAKTGSLEGFDEIPDDVKAVFKTSRDVDPAWHLKMQAAFQKHVDNAVSKTCNFPNSATRDDIRKSYMLAYELGCKGVTVYRDGSRDLQVLSLKNDAEKTGSLPADAQASKKGIRPERLMGYTHKIRTSEGKFYLTVNELDGKPFEIFSTPNSRSREASVNAEALCRLISLSLRHGININFIFDQLQKVRNQSLLSLPYNIARVLSAYMSEDEEEDKSERPLRVKQSLCPECGTTVEHEGGCLVCRGCGYSKCA